MVALVPLMDDWVPFSCQGWETRPHKVCTGEALHQTRTFLSVLVDREWMDYAVMSFYRRKHERGLSGDAGGSAADLDAWERFLSGECNQKDQGEGQLLSSIISRTRTSVDTPDAGG